MQGALHAAADGLYEAALDASKWSSALAKVRDAVGGTACGIRFESFVTPAVTQTWVGLEPEWERAYLAHYWQDDIWAETAKSFRPGSCATSDALLGASVRKQSAFINELCMPFEIDDLVGGLISLTDRQMISFAAMKRRGRRPFNTDHAAMLTSLLPHVKRVVMVDEALRDARENQRTAWSMVDRLPVGAIVVDAGRRVLHQNVAATRMIEAGLVLDSRPFRELLRTLQPRRLAVAGKHFTAVAIHLPAEETAFGLADQRGRTLVLITDPSSRALPPAEVLMTLYGLTISEARVALLVGTGLAPKEAASELGTSWNTVRTQLGQVFGKTQTSGQVALVRLLVQLGLTAQ